MDLTLSVHRKFSPYNIVGKVRFIVKKKKISQVSVPFCHKMAAFVFQYLKWLKKNHNHITSDSQCEFWWINEKLFFIDLLLGSNKVGAPVCV